MYGKKRTCIIITFVMLNNLSFVFSNKYQLIKKGEDYINYELRELEPGATKLNMKQFYECAHNIEFIKLPDGYFGEYSQYKNKLNNYCTSIYKTFRQFRVPYFVNLLKQSLETFNLCLLGIPKMAKNVHPYYFQCMKNEVTNGNYNEEEILNIFFTIEVRMCSCITVFHKFQEKKLATCLGLLISKHNEIRNIYQELEFTFKQEDVDNTIIYTDIHSLKLIELLANDSNTVKNKKQLGTRFFDNLIYRKPPYEASRFQIFMYPPCTYERPELETKSKEMCDDLTNIKEPEFTNLLKKNLEYLRSKMNRLFPNVKDDEKLDKLTTVVENIGKIMRSNIPEVNQLNNIFMRILKILDIDSAVNLSNIFGLTEPENNSDHIKETTEHVSEIIENEPYYWYLCRIKEQDKYIPLTEELWLDEKKHKSSDNHTIAGNNGYSVPIEYHNGFY